MLAILSPAKTLDMETDLEQGQPTEPQLVQQASELVDVLKTYTPARLGSLMKLSDKLAKLNVERFKQWSLPSGEHNARQAIFAFQGDVYQGLDAHSLDKRSLNYANKHLRILSGLYGLLCPFDWLQAYRLEMGTQLQTPEGANLYAFWGDTITEHLQESIKAAKAKAVVNLASQEYFKAVRSNLLQVPVIEPVFKDEKKGQFKVISFYAKRARGMMARYMIESKAKTPDALKSFDVAGYRFSEKESDQEKLVFKRTEKPAQRYAGG